MYGWEEGLAVCEIGGAADPRAHDHSSEPLVCANCAMYACDFHGDHSREDEEWLCALCYDAEGERLARTA